MEPTLAVDRKLFIQMRNGKQVHGQDSKLPTVQQVLRIATECVNENITQKLGFDPKTVRKVASVEEARKTSHIRALAARVRT